MSCQSSSSPTPRIQVTWAPSPCRRSSLLVDPRWSNRDRPRCAGRTHTSVPEPLDGVQERDVVARLQPPHTQDQRQPGGAGGPPGGVGDGRRRHNPDTPDRPGPGGIRVDEPGELAAEAHRAHRCRRTTTVRYSAKPLGSPRGRRSALTKGMAS